MEDPAVTNFRDYIRINTMQPNPDYASCVQWLKKQAVDLGAKMQVTECVPGKPIVVLSIQGKEPSLSSILLNSHTDVVPVFPELWKYDPFSAHKDEEGNIFGRGTQDMKCVGVQYIEAMKRLKEEGTTLLRSVHLSFVPDEEIGGCDGMEKFINTEEFKNLNVGFALDEGYASQDENFLIFYGERSILQFWIKCPGTPGHGSQFLPNNSGKKLQAVIDKFMEFRDREEKKLAENSDLCLGDVTTVNLTMLKGGVQFNVVPAELSVGFDVRIPPAVTVTDFENMISKWLKEIGTDLTLEYSLRSIFQSTTSTDDGKNIWWDTFSKACKKEDIHVKKRIFPAATDVRYLRKCGIPAFGFSPMNKTPLLLHDNNEFLNENIYLRGIEIYTTIIKEVANLAQ